MVTELEKIKDIFKKNIKKIDKDAKLITIKKYGIPYTTIDYKEQHSLIFGVQIKNTNLTLDEFKTLYRKHLSPKLAKVKGMYSTLNREEKQKELFVGLINIVL